MTTYTDEVNIYNPEAVGEGIDGAAQTATNYIQADETGIRIANANPGTATTYQHQTATDTEFIVDGESRLLISGDGQRIGKAYVEGATDNESHMELDYHSLQMVDKDGIAYMHVSDLRDESGKAHIELGMQRTFSRHAIFDISDYANYTNVVVSVVNPLSGDITSQCEITVTGILQEPAFSVIIDVPNSISILPSYGLYVYISLDTDAHYVPESAMAFTLGSRSKSASNRIGGGSVSFGRQNNSGGLFGFASGQMNYVSGECAASLGAQCSAIGKHSVAMNYGTDASSDRQTVLGAYNKPDVIGKYALIVGNGTAGNARSNAHTLDWQGNAVYAGDLAVLGNYIVQGWAGVIQMFAGTTPPAGWLLCDGSAVSRTIYSTLYAAIGDTWGAGDGSTTFNLPDLRGRAPIGAGTGTGLSARTLGGTVGAETVKLTAGESGLPAHTHAFSNVLTNPETVARRTVSSGSGATNHLYSSGATSRANTTGAVSGGAKDATSAHNNMQPSAVVNFIIHTGKTS